MGGSHEVLSITPFQCTLHSRHVGHDSLCVCWQHTCATRLRAAAMGAQNLLGKTLFDVFLAMKHPPLGH